MRTCVRSSMYIPPDCSCPTKELNFGLKGCAAAELGGNVACRFIPGNLCPTFPSVPGPRLGRFVGATGFMFVCGIGGGGLFRVRLDVNGLELTFWPGIGAADVEMALLCGGDFS